MKNHLIVIGGTSGIGWALANAHLQENWQVTVVGSTLEKIASIENSHAHLTCLQADISDPSACTQLLKTLNKQTFNRLIYCAGKYYNERKHHLTSAESHTMLAVNLQAFNQIMAWASEQLKTTSQPNKHLIAIASVAGLLEFAEASLYAKCKRAMIATCEAYRVGLEPFGIAVTCIASGYIDTETLRQLNDGNASHKPYLISETEAVTEIMVAINHNLALHIFPKPMKRTISLLSVLPKSLLNRVMRVQYRQQDKKVANI